MPLLINPITMDLSSFLYSHDPLHHTNSRHHLPPHHPSYNHIHQNLSHVPLEEQSPIYTPTDQFQQDLQQHLQQTHTSDLTHPQQLYTSFRLSYGYSPSQSSSSSTSSTSSSPPSMLNLLSSPSPTEMPDYPPGYELIKTSRKRKRKCQQQQVQQRQAANMRERKRMQSINDAFEATNGQVTFSKYLGVVLELKMLRNQKYSCRKSESNFDV
ncbi:protein twist-like [Aplysia californica]|uniref:Protein twist-like n=1 Tax=Aplysia californica TaxID=6500 RepID=A0ABM1A1E3_APLCA|nr:protein twist-like [Aplysia californica]